MGYLRFGKGGGEKYVILPGISLKSVLGSEEAIVSAYAPIAGDFDVYLFDHIKKEPKDYTIEDMAQDTLKAFEKLGIEKATVMGVSMGGMVALAMAVKKPKAAARLILCSTAPKGSAKVLDEWKSLAEKKDAKTLSKSFGEYVYTPSFYEKHKGIIDGLGDGASDLDFANFVRSVEAIKAFDVSDQLYLISCPAFVIGAGEDRVLGAKSSYELMEGIGCKGYIYEGKGHGVYDEAPDYLQRIKDHLERDN